MTNTLNQRARCAKEVYNAIFLGTVSFEEDDIGADLAYLLGAILLDDFCSWPTTRPILGILRETFPANHAVWQHITLENEEGEPPQDNVNAKLQQLSQAFAHRARQIQHRKE